MLIHSCTGRRLSVRRSLLLLDLNCSIDVTSWLVLQSQTEEMLSDTVSAQDGEATSSAGVDIAVEMPECGNLFLQGSHCFPNAPSLVS